MSPHTLRLPGARPLEVYRDRVTVSGWPPRGAEVEELLRRELGLSARIVVWRRRNNAHGRPSEVWEAEFWPAG
jgi:hypothetical protein